MWARRTVKGRLPTIGVKRVGAMSLVSRFGISIETGLLVWDVEETKGKKSIPLLCFTLRADSVATPFCFFLSFFRRESKSVWTHSPTPASFVFYTRSASEGYKSGASHQPILSSNVFMHGKCLFIPVSLL